MPPSHSSVEQEKLTQELTEYQVSIMVDGVKATTLTTIIIAVTFQIMFIFYPIIIILQQTEMLKMMCMSMLNGNLNIQYTLNI